jgi:hypothetical protein
MEYQREREWLEKDFGWTSIFFFLSFGLFQEGWIIIDSRNKKKT